jgi:hypothetical protein
MMFSPFRDKTRFSPALRAISLYANAFDAEGNGWVRESAAAIIFRVSIPQSDDDIWQHVAGLEERLQEQDVRVALGVKYRRVESTDAPYLYIHVPPQHLVDFVKAINPSPSTKNSAYYDISEVRV